MVFREWLVKQVKITRWPKISDDSPADLADRLGITLSLLEEAKQERAEDLRRRGKVSRQLGNRAVYHTGVGRSGGPTWAPSRIFTALNGRSGVRTGTLGEPCLSPTPYRFPNLPGHSFSR
ncbi:MAG TPA: hypothetical protein VNW92_04630 [Polyangiaceae bacterium]|nr:hypothetical protein [Polyangiaceae bacterium]